MTETFQPYKPGIGVIITSLLLALALLAGVVPQVVMAAPAPSVSATCAKYHTVVSGDTLSSISVTYDISIAELAAANNLTEPYTLTVGQSICIPGTAASTTTTTDTKSTKREFTIERQGNYLVINAANFPKKSSYVVKLKKGRMSLPMPWVKIGVLRTRKNTDVIQSFRLPKNFFDTPVIQVCLKNSTSDAVMCLPFHQ